MRTSSDILAFCAVAVAVLALGGVHTPVAGFVAVLALGAASLGLRARQRSGRSGTLSYVGAAALLAQLLCVLQLIPAPDLLHRLLNPTEHALWLHGAELAGIADRAWRPLSLDPAATADRAIRYGALAAIALWGASTSSRRRWYQYIYGLAAVGVAALLFGWVLMSQGGDVFGLYHSAIGFRGPSPFVSTNHGASFFGLAMLAAAGASLHLRHTSARAASVLGVVAAVFCVATFALDSDGVNVALALTGGVAAMLQWARHRGKRALGRDVKIGALLIATMSALLAVWLDLHVLLGNALARVALSGEHGARWHLMSVGLEASVDFWRFGAGAGAVSTVLPAVVDWSLVVPSSIPLIENDSLELVLSFGWPLALVLFVACAAQLGAAARAALRRGKPRQALAVVTAVFFAVIAQLHFPLFALGVSLPAVALLEVLWARRATSEASSEAGFFALTPRASAALLAVIAVGLLGAGIARMAYKPATDAREALYLQPASHVPHVKLATQALRAREPGRAIAHAEQAVAREPSPRVRLYFATLLAEVDDPRAIDEFRSLLVDGARSNRVLDKFAEAFDTPEQVVAVLAGLPDAWQPVVRRLAVHRDRDFVSSVIVGLVTSAPEEVRGYYVASEAYLQMREPVLARLWAEHAAELERRSGEDDNFATVLLARALRASGDAEAAQRLLSDPQIDLTRDAHREALRLGATSASIRSLRHHFDEVCVSPIPTKDQQLCWTVEARIATENGEYARTEQILDRLARRYKQLLPLAEHYNDRGQCLALRQLVRRAEDSQRSQIERLIKSCSTRVDTP